MSTPEAKIKTQVKKLLKSYDKLYIFMPVPQGFQAASLDYFVCYTGKFIAIETKKPGGKLTALQERTKRIIEDAGGRVFVISNTTEDIDSLKLFLDQIH